jgi:hypothetical protein
VSALDGLDAINRTIGKSAGLHPSAVLNLSDAAVTMIDELGPHDQSLNKAFLAFAAFVQDSYDDVRIVRVGDDGHPHLPFEPLEDFTAWWALFNGLAKYWRPEALEVAASLGDTET